MDIDKRPVFERLFSGLGKTLAASLFAFALIPMSLISIFGYLSAHKSLDNEINRHLLNLAELKTGQIERYFDNLLLKLEYQSGTETSSVFLTSLIHAHQESGLSASDFVKTYEWAVINDRLSGDVRSFRRFYNLIDIYYVDADGNILFSIEENEDLGTSLNEGTYSHTRFAHAVGKTLKTGNLSFSDYERYEPSGGQTTGFMVSPVTNPEGDRIGAMALQFSIRPISNIMKGTFSDYQKAEIYLLGEDLTLRSKMMSDPSKKLLQEIVDTEQTRLIKEHITKGYQDLADHHSHSTLLLYQGPHGYEVLGLHNAVNVAGVHFSVIAELSESEAFKSVYDLRNISWFLTGITALLVIIFVILIVNRTLRPVLKLSAATQRVKEGDYSQVIEVETKNEIGDLAVSFNSMVRSLEENQQKEQLKEWFQTGFVGLNKAMRGTLKVSDQCRGIVSFLAKYIDAEIGAFYLKETDNTLQLTGSYALTTRKSMTNRAALGEGLVGQAALEKNRILLTHVPKDFFPIQSGTGELQPGQILVEPLVRENELIGVVEFGTLNQFSKDALDFVDAAVDSIAIELQTTLAHNRVQDLLQQSQAQTEELKASEEQLQAQQEELRQANEELEEYADSLKKSESKLQEQQKELQQTNEELEEKTERLELQKAEIEQKNEELNQAQVEIEEKAQELEISSRYKSEFLANMSHELRTPLNSILLLSRLFMDNRDESLSQEQVESAQAIYTSGTDLLKLINEVLDLSKIESGKMELTPETIPLEGFVANLEKAFKPFADEKGLELIRKISADVPSEIVSDAQRLEQILKNFLSNALKFTEKGSITLSVEVANREQYERLYIIPEEIPDKMIAFSVVDTGVGIPEKKQHLIFEAFQQADGSTSRRYGGTGLGLSISRELAKRLGGVIQLESREGVGSRFTVYIPEQYETSKEPGINQPTLQPEPLKQGGPSAEPRTEKTDARVIEPKVESGLVKDDRKSIHTKDKSILIIEDDATFGKILYKMSHEHGFKCVVAETGETGLQLAEVYQPSAIILDIGLPGIDGWKVMERLKSNSATRHIPVHFISAADMKKDALNMGAIDFLTKPVSPSLLENAFENIERIISKKVKDLLLIEDNAEQSQAIKALIGNGDVKFKAVDTAEEGLREIRTNKYDCVILDLGLPDASGIDLLKTIRNEASFRYLPIIVYTGKELQPEEINIINQYAETTITKGVNSHQRLLDETTLFLHRVEKELPSWQQNQIRMLHDKEAVLNGKTILVVDDDMRNVYSVKKILEENGMKVLVGKNGKEALEKLEQHVESIDLVLMDIMMPEMDGYEAMTEIRRRPDSKHLPIIALTAKAMKGDKAKCIEAGANDYLAKPLDVDRLLSMLRVWLYN